jgi:pimeloyl-ACP methyl ester carboxylesterase
MQRTTNPIDGFHLAYEREGEGPAVVLLHGWPGARSDYREVAKRLPGADVIRPDLRGFGDSDRLDRPPEQYGADGQADSILGLIEDLGLQRPVIAGYDVGSRVAQALVRKRPDVPRALVLSPPMPGVGERVLLPGPQAEFWYQHFHRLDLAEQLVDGKPDVVRAYLEHFWDHWSAPAWRPPAALLDELTEIYARPGAFITSIQWYRAGSGTVARALAERAPEQPLAVPMTVLWPEHDPLFPFEWSDRLGEFFADIDLRHMPGVGHFSPLEAPDTVAAAIRERLAQ